MRAAGAIAAAALFVGIGRARRAGALADPACGAGFDRRYWLVVAAEAAALVAGMVMINQVFAAHELTVAWIAVVVGVHYLGLAALWEVRAFVVVGVELALLGAAGFALHAGGASNVAVAAVSGIGSGVALYLAVARSLLHAAAWGTAKPVAQADRTQP